MTFTFKLSMRLALIRAVLLPAAAATSSTVQSSSTVKNRGALTEVFVTPATVSVTAGGTRQFLAYGRKRNGDSVSVNVSYTATGGGISAAGLYSAGQNAGSYRVIAVNGPTALADTAAVAISILPVASVTVAPATASVAVGQVVGLVATLKDANGNALSGRVVTWASSAAAVATVDSSGVVTGVAAGGAMISATSEGQGGGGARSVAAGAWPPGSVARSPRRASAGGGPTVRLTA